MCAGTVRQSTAMQRAAQQHRVQFHLDERGEQNGVCVCVFVYV